MAPSKKKRAKPPRRPEKRRVETNDLGSPALRDDEIATTSALQHERFPIVGIGASAGGLEAFSQLLHAMPERPGLAIVLVPHLSPQHESVLPVLLSTRTKMHVVQATDGVRVEPNMVYVLPPNVQMGMLDGALHLLPRPTDRTQYTPIDFFFRSLADTCQEWGIAVILSGTASDGTIGLREVKGAGGIVLAQTPETAKYDGMPRAAIATNLVDLVLSPEEIAAELVRIAQHPLAPLPAPHATGKGAVGDEQDPLARILLVLRSASGVDFMRYKRPTLERRIQRRMVLHKFTRIDQYLTYLMESAAEAQALYQDILIHVTRFFRDPDSFEALKQVVFPEIVPERRDHPIRVWVPGCSTGEEAYSAAIALLEYLGDDARSVPVQVFATDVSDPAVEHARAGIYPESIAGDVSPERLRRFFSRMDGGYRISKLVRDMCVFARQDLTRDPPFSKLDLILCRNVLIYMGVDLQKKLMNIFHYALKPNGFLALGNAETIGLHSDLFTATDKKHRIYRKKMVAIAAPGIPFAIEQAALAPTQERRAVVIRPDTERSVVGEANRLMQDRYSPPGVIVDHDLNILQFRGQTGDFLTPPPGEPSLSLLKMAREGLLHALRSAIQDARRKWTTVAREGVRVRTNGGWREIAVHVVPLGTSAERAHFLIVFVDEARRPSEKKKGSRIVAPLVRARDARKEDDARMVRLQQELASSREYLQSIIQELEAANEELQSANEEILSSNEELQSTNEELDTAKEELQSTNEELNTVNEELHSRNEELTRVNSDLINLLGSVQIAIVIVATDQRIRRFTPMAERVLNLIPTDVGRPITHIKPNIDCPDLEELIANVIDTVTPIEREVRDAQGSWMSLRIRPYKNTENKIDGAVLALFDIHTTKQHEQELRRLRLSARAMVDVVRDPFAVLDEKFRVQTANRAFWDAFGVGPDGAAGKPLATLTGGAWDARALQERLAGEVRPDAPLASIVLDGGGPDRARVEVLARLISGTGDGALIVVSVRDHGEAATGGRGTR
jgi:two-component system CheB/CheR fusion protein